VNTGDAVVLRYVSRGRAVGALPTRVAQAGAPVLWLASGTEVKWAGVSGRHVRDVPLLERYSAPWGAVDSRWDGDGVVIVGRPGRAHSIWLFWEDWRFRGWYVNLEAPWRPYPFGFETEDHTLDLWVAADGEWNWKDEDELEVAVEVGFFSAAQAAEFRAEGERVLAEWPFPTGWEAWRPDPDWSTPSLPSGWAA
jgi:uncharacterized protein